MNKIFSIVDYTIIHATIRATTPILLAAFSAVITQQADILNVGVEGIMLMGAFIAVYVCFITGSWILAVIAAVVAGVIIAAIMGVAHLKYKGDIFAVGTVINLLVLALTRFLLQQLLGVSGSFTLKDNVSIPKIHLKIFEGNKILNSLFNDYSLFEILSIPLIILLWFLLYKTVWGLRTRSIGLNPEAAKTAGIDVYKRKFEVILISGVIGGLAGAVSSAVSSGSGFMGVAAMFFGAANPIFTTIGCLIFGFTDSVGARLQAHGFPSQFVLMLPYIITISILSVSMIRQYKKIKKRRSAI